MKQIIRLGFITLLLMSSLAWGQGKQPATVKMTMQAFQAKDHGLHLAIIFKNEKKWHTYWKNPGDAGIPMKVNFFIEDTPVKFEEREWPAPRKYLEEGDILAYGYEGTYSLFFKFSKDLQQRADGKTVKVVATWLACKSICLPGKGEMSGKFSMNSREIKPSNKAPFKISEDELEKHYAKIPQIQSDTSQLDLSMGVNLEKNGLILYYNISSVKKSAIPSFQNILTPFPQEPMGYAHEKLALDSNSNLYGQLPIEWDGEYQEPPEALPTDGQFLKPYKLKFLYYNPQTAKTTVVEKTFSSFSTNGAQRLADFFKSLTPVTFAHTTAKGASDASAETSGESSEGGFSLFYYLLFAFLGGLILNVMPCVLPVISLKLFGLIKHRDANQKVILKHNIFYTLGVLFSFVVLGLAVILIKMTGEHIGWGFQLQSPSFVIGMIVILFIFTLNLFGLFEFATPGGKKLGNVNFKEGMWGDFFGGILATVLATPCSAPFLGTALTFAFTSSNATVIGVFLMIGLGLSFPFILSGFFPVLISFLPKPGNWMEHLKKFLGLALILTTIWLLDVFSSLVSSPLALIKLNLALAFTFFAFYFNKHISKKKRYIVFLVIIPTMTLMSTFSDIRLTSSTQNKEMSVKLKPGNLQWEKWSEAAMAEHAKAGNIVFIDFTANWCFTCKINEKLVLNTDGFKKLIKQYDLKLLLGDWTKRDAVIGEWLKKQGVVGVPAYFIQAPDGTLTKLGEVITLDGIEKALRKVKSGNPVIR